MLFEKIDYSVRNTLNVPRCVYLYFDFLIPVFQQQRNKFRFITSVSLIFYLPGTESRPP